MSHTQRYEVARSSGGATEGDSCKLYNTAPDYAEITADVSKNWTSDGGVDADADGDGGKDGAAGECICKAKREVEKQYVI